MVSALGSLAHGLDSSENVHVYSLLGFSTHKNVTCYPTRTKFWVRGFSSGIRGLLWFRAGGHRQTKRRRTPYSTTHVREETIFVRAAKSKVDMNQGNSCCYVFVWPESCRVSV